jgi:hypothetical protein
MSSNIRPAVTTAVAAAITGAVFGGVFATATGWDLNTYMKFVGFLVVVAFVVVGAWIYQTYMKPKPAHGEESSDGR